MKFLLDEAVARDVERQLARRMVLDPHGDSALDHAYRIATVYCDTPGLDVYHRRGSLRQRKYRMRRYGTESQVFLERKTKQGERVRKRRVAVEARDLPALASFPTDPEWPGNWFHRQIVMRKMVPVCGVAYVRTAYFGAVDEGPIRLTFDRDVRAALVSEWEPSAIIEGAPVLEGRVVCEFKFRGALPTLFKNVIRELALAPGGVSKYRRGFQLAGGISDGSRQDA